MISDSVKKAAKDLFGANIKVETCGSYRRGRATCGDVDILITRTDDKSTNGMLEKIVNRLESQKFLLERLSLSKAELGKSREAYMGVCRVKKAGALARRIDMKAYPKE